MKNDLTILWTNDNRVTAEKMVLMYGGNALKKGWWDSVTIVIWGATAELAARDVKIRERIREMIDGGVKFSACKSCAEQLGLAENLEELGVEVIYWGEPLTEILKSGNALLTI